MICPNCPRNIPIHPRMAGLPTTCPFCGHSFLVPFAAADTLRWEMHARAVKPARVLFDPGLPYRAAHVHVRRMRGLFFCSREFTRRFWLLVRAYLLCAATVIAMQISVALYRGAPLNDGRVGPQALLSLAWPSIVFTACVAGVWGVHYFNAAVRE